MEPPCLVIVEKDYASGCKHDNHSTHSKSCSNWEYATWRVPDRTWSCNHHHWAVMHCAGAYACQNHWLPHTCTLGSSTWGRAPARHSLPGMGGP
jgi:hypothetical protein